MSPVSRSVSRPVSRSILAGQSNTLASIIKSLFANNEQGFAYDPNDLTTMFQDAAGTVPVTGVGQPVGLIKDKSGRGNHARQTVSASRPILQRNATTGAYYLAFDGTDDYLVTNSIDFTATDKISLFAGVRKLSDGAQNFVAGLGIAAGNGTFSIFAPSFSNGKNFAVWSKGTLLSANAYSTTHTSPISSVVTGKANISGDATTLRVNSVNIVTDTTDQGTGSYSNAQIYIGRNNGTNFPFNGHIYSLIGIGRLTTDAETIALEKSIAKNTGVTLSV